MNKLNQWTLWEKLIHWNQDFEHCTVPDVEEDPVSSSVQLDEFNSVKTVVELCDIEIQQELRSLHLVNNRNLRKVSDQAYRIIKWIPVDLDLAKEFYKRQKQPRSYSALEGS